MKKYKIFLCCLLCSTLFCSGCSSSTQEKETTSTATNTNTQTTTISNTVVSYDAFDLDDDYSDEDIQKVTLHKNSITFEGEGASVNKTTLTIEKAGTYVVEGSLTDGCIIVDAGKKDLVRIVLNGVTLTSSNCAGIYIKQADKVLLTLAKDTTNTITDGSSYVLENTTIKEPNAAIYAKDDMTINGSGSLIVHARYNNGIQSKDDLKIISGKITVTAKNHGIVGKDCLAIRDGILSIDAQGDGLKTTNTTESDKAILCIEGGTLNINAQQDGIQSENTLYVYGGKLNITAGGGNTKGTKMRKSAGFNPFEQESSTSEDTISMKGIKATNALIIKNGTITIDSADDSIHSNSSITIEKGILQLSSGDDGIHADKKATIKDGTITIKTSYEGLEAANIFINGGNLHIAASDDGINAASSSSSTSPILQITNGYVFVDADADGLDSNGDIKMSGGTLIINGTQSNGDGALDFDGSFTISGGTFIASASSGMLQYPSTVSNGNLAVIGFNSAQTEMVHVLDTSGTTLLTYKPTTSYDVLLYYSAKLKTGMTYEVVTGGTASNGVDGVYSNETYQGGSTYSSFKITSTTTTLGNVRSMNGGGGGPRP